MNTQKSFKFRRKIVILLSSMVLLMLSACCMLYAMTRTQCAIVRPVDGPVTHPLMSDTRGASLRKLTAEAVLEPDQNVEYTDSADDYQVQDSLGQIGATPGDVHVPTNSMLRTNKSATKKVPDAIIVGVKKGGTRALLEFVRIHPDVRAAGRETHYFDRHYHLGSEWYRNQMPATLEGQLTLEKTPSYFVTKEAPQRIAHMNKKTKIIIVVRDPVTRAISDYTQTSSKRPGMKKFEQMAILDNTTGIVDTSWGAIRIGVYAKHIERWLKYFPLSQICFINGEKLISNPAGELEKLQDFLGLKSVITDKHFFFNETKGFPCIKKPEGSANPKCLGKTKGRLHPYVEPRVLNRLQEFYRPFNAKFYQITNQNFGWP